MVVSAVVVVILQVVQLRACSSDSYCRWQRAITCTASQRALPSQCSCCCSLPSQPCMLTACTCCGRPHSIPLDAQVSEARLIELLEQVSEQSEKKTKVQGLWVRGEQAFCCWSECPSAMQDQ